MSLSEEDLAAKKKKKEIRRRRIKVLEMYNRGVSEKEMAEALGVNQSTISRDISDLSSKARNDLVSKTVKNHWLEVQRITLLYECALKKTCELADSKDLTVRERIAALSLLLKCCNSIDYLIPEQREMVMHRGTESLTGQAS